MKFSFCQQAGRLPAVMPATRYADFVTMES
jgi:hypothetical protein